MMVKEMDIRDNYDRFHLLEDEPTRSRLARKYEDALKQIDELRA